MKQLAAIVFFSYMCASSALICSDGQLFETEWALCHPNRLPSTPANIGWREVKVAGKSGVDRLRYRVHYDRWVEVDTKTFVAGESNDLQWKWEKTVATPRGLEVSIPSVNAIFTIPRGSISAAGTSDSLKVNPANVSTTRFSQNFQIADVTNGIRYRSAVLFASFTILVEIMGRDGWERVGEVSGLSPTWTNVWYVEAKGVGEE